MRGKLVALSLGLVAGCSGGSAANHVGRAPSADSAMAGASARPPRSAASLIESLGALSGRSRVDPRIIRQIAFRAPRSEIVGMLTNDLGIVRLVGAEIFVQNWPDEADRVRPILLAEFETEPLVHVLVAEIDHPACRALLRAASARPTKSVTRGFVLTALAEADKTEALTLARDALVDPSIASAALDALGALDATAEEPAISAIANDPTAPARAAAIAALGRLTSDDAVRTLRAIGEQAANDDGIGDAARSAWIANPARRAKRLGADAARAKIEAPVRAILEALASGDVKTLSSFVHTKRGLRFGFGGRPDWKPWSTTEVMHMLSDPTKRAWGVTCGTGDLARGTNAEYLKTVVRGAGLLRPGVTVAYDPWEEIENLSLGAADADFEWTFPEAVFVEITNDETSWYSLRLVFEPDGDGLGLVAAVPNQWCP